MRVKDKVKEGNIDPEYYKKLAQIESSGNPNAINKDSKAAGLYQFTKRTWKGLTEQLGLDYDLDDRFDPDKSMEVLKVFTKQNRNYLKKKLGREPSQSELYLAHFRGMGGATKLIQNIEANPNMLVTEFVPESHLEDNKSVFYNKDGTPKKAFEIYDWSAKKFGEKTYQEKFDADKEIYATNTKGEVVNVNPKLATEQEKQMSDTFKKEVYTMQDVQKIRAEKQQPTNTKTEEEEEQETLDPWQEKLQKKMQKRNFMMELINSGYGDLQVVERTKQQI